MPEDDPFADLGETLADEPEETATETESQSGRTTDDSPAEETREQRNPISDTAFSYEEANQRPFYAREETIQEFDAWLKYELERELDEEGYQNIVVRELTDALLRTVVEEDLVKAVGERFEQARRSACSESNE
jgi:hypothetical protein